MRNFPLVSIVTVVYNGETELERTIESSLEQDYSAKEYIIIDGGSTDGTLEIISRYAGKVACFVSERDSGVYDAMNKGVASAKGEFIIFMNCGDVFADATSLSLAMSHLVPGKEQALFGGWYRSEKKQNLKLCSPNISSGVFNHQAVIYSISLHQKFGKYTVAKGLTTADYLFFAQIFECPLVQVIVINDALAIINVEGISSGAQTLSQKFAIDFLLGRTTAVRLAAVLLLHPIYHVAKRIVRGGR